MKYKKIVVAGGGVLGSQIAFQTAYSGFNVVILIRKEDSKKDVEDKLSNLNKTYLKMINDMSNKDSGIWARGIVGYEDFNKDLCIKQANMALKNINIINSQEDALKDADLVIESITEIFDIKKSFYLEIANKLDEKTILVTNSSTLLPSKLAKFTGREKKFLSMHFANSIWKNNICEIMGHGNTDNNIFDEVFEFAKAIKMIPLKVMSEKSGYLLNSMLVPFLLSSMDLLANGVGNPEDIDKAWKLGTGAPKGPFEIIDTVGLETAKNIVLQYQKVPKIINPLLKKMMLPYNYDGMLKILNKYLDEGKKGKSVNEGFYKY